MVTAQGWSANVNARRRMPELGFKCFAAWRNSPGPLITRMTHFKVQANPILTERGTTLSKRIYLTAAIPLAAAAAIAFGGSAASATASAHPAAHQPSAKFVAKAKSALVKYLARTPDTAMFVHKPGNATTATESYNWAGWADVSNTSQEFTKVSGSWVTPQLVSCSKEDTITSEWVGLDGWNSDTVEQDGTLDWCFQDTPVYFTWYEMYPAGTVEVGESLAPGDAITASVTRAGTAYTLALTDSTNTANSFTEHATCALATCLDNSAEWIAERPSFSIGIAPLANFGSWHLTGASETAGGKTGNISSFPTNDRVTSIDATETYDIASVSSLTTGNAFTATWKDSY